MSITTMEQLAELETGTAIRVGDPSNTWTKEGNRWMRDGIPLQDVHFAGDVARGRVLLTTAPHIGQVWTDSVWYYVLVAEGVDAYAGQWHVLRCNSEGTFNRMTRIRVENHSYVSTQPDWAPNLTIIGQHIRNIDVTREQLAAQYNTEHELLVTERRQHSIDMDNLKTGVERGLHAFVTENPDARQVIGDLLAEQGMSRPPTMVGISVEVQGRSIVNDIPAEMIDAAVVPGTDSVRLQGAMYVWWTKTLTGEVQGPEGECACGNVGRDWVVQKFNEEDFSCSSIDGWVGRCANHEEEVEPDDEF